MAIPFDAQENVLEESKLMIPDTRQRLEGALQDLTSYVVSSDLLSYGHRFLCPACHLQSGRHALF